MKRDDLKNIAKEISTQDNRITENPLFCVFQKERIYGLTDDYSDTWEWCNSDSQCSCEPDEQCEGSHDGCEQCYYVERDRFINAHFTEKSANHYIKIDGHNLTKPFTYVTSLWRCYEMIDIRNFLMSGGKFDVDKI